MMDYLKWKTKEPFCNDSILVMNSVGMIQTAIEKAKAFANIVTYFDNDNPGRAATAAFKGILPRSVDHFWVY